MTEEELAEFIADTKAEEDASVEKAAAAEDELEQTIHALQAETEETPETKKRQPTLRERLYYKTIQDQHPEQAAKFLRDKNIDPSFDVGFQLHDITTDIAGDALRAGGGILGGIGGGIIGSVKPGVGTALGAIAGSAAGGAGAQLLADELAGAIGPKIPTKESVPSAVKTGALEGAGTALFGVGKVASPALGAAKATIFKGRYNPIARGLEKLGKTTTGIDPKDMKYLGENRHKLYDLLNVRQIRKGSFPTQKSISDILKTSWVTAKDSMKKADDDLFNQLTKKGLKSPAALGLDEPNLLVLTDSLDIPGVKASYNRIQRLLKQDEVLNDGLVTPQAAFEIYRTLGKMNEPFGHAGRIRKKIQDAFTLGDEKTARLWNIYTDKAKNLNDLRKLNNGDDWIVGQATAKGREKTKINFSPDLYQKTADAFAAPVDNKVIQTLDDA